MNAKEQFHYYNQSDIFNLNPHFNKSPLSLRNRTPLSHTQPVDTNLSHIKTSTFTQYNILSHNNPSSINYTPEYVPQPYTRNKTKHNQTKPKHLNKTTALITSTNLNDIILDTTQFTKKEYETNMTKNNKSKVCLGIDNQNYYTTTNAFNQTYAKKQILKAKLLSQQQQHDKPIQNSKSDNSLLKKATKPHSTFTTTNTSGSHYDTSMNSFQNKCNFQKSNIFNDPDKEKQNRSITPLRTVNVVNTTSTHKQHVKQKQKPNELLLPHMDWADTSTQLIFRKRNQTEAKTAKELKMINNKGSMFNTKYSDYKNETKIIMEKTLEKTNDEKKQLKQLNENQRSVDMFTIDNIANNKKFDMNKIKKIYRDNGLHIFGEKTDFFIINGNNKGKASFKIRSNNDKGDYKVKLKQAEDKIRNEIGIKITNKNK